MVLRQHTQHYQSIKVLGGIYSRLRLILDRRLRELDKLALKNNSKDTRRIRASELSFTLNETRALELLLARPTDPNLIRKIIRLLRLKLLCTIETPLDDEIRSQIKTAEDDICGNTKIEFSVQQGQCHNFVKTRTEYVEFPYDKDSVPRIPTRTLRNSNLRSIRQPGFHFIGSVVKYEHSIKRGQQRVGGT
jgi:hypothetical protein